MPIYDYRCTSCGFEKEYLQKVSDPVMTICPQCHQESYVKKLTAAGFQLKGSGWYATDFRNGGTKPAGDAKADGKAETKPDGKSDAGGDGKADSTTPAAAAHACGTGGCGACS